MNKVENLQTEETQALNTPVVEHRVNYQGAITVNNCITYQKSNNIIAFCIDTENKWGEIFATGSNENGVPCIVLEANENTTNIRNKKTIEDLNLTEIEFPDYSGWTIFCCSWSKYSVYVCMVKLDV